MEQSRAVREKEKQERRTQLARLAAPAHIVQNRFEEHARVEGYIQNRNVPDFYGCDRLWKMETIYGTIQLGYDPRRGHSFLFAHIKTSILDTAASSHEKNLWESQMMREQKRGNENIAYGARRRPGSATLLYKKENKPWTQASVAPYLRRVNMETLRKTMPFLGREAEQTQRGAAAARWRTLGETLRMQMQSGQYAEMADTRAQQLETQREQEELGALLARKGQQSLLFFRKVNLAFDLQKAKMFEYYREERRRRALVAQEGPAEPEMTPGDTTEHGKRLRDK